RRLPPTFASSTLIRRHYGAARLDLLDQTPEVLLFPDTFANYYDPAPGLAALEVLNALGCKTLLGVTGSFGSVPSNALDWPGLLTCWGRPFISNGMLDQAVRVAEQNTRSLYPWIARRRFVVGCEPSCILTIKDDYPALLRGELREQAQSVARVCHTFEEYVDILLANRMESPFRPGPKRILVQGHCHQRSLVGMGATLRILRRIPGAEVIDLDAGCCGMAGSFGYEKEHYEISRLVGEQRLFPAGREGGGGDRGRAARGLLPVADPHLHRPPAVPPAAPPARP